jgi:hypothetical protein
MLRIESVLGRVAARQTLLGIDRMKLVMTLLVRDEEDIVADALDFHLAQGVDQVIVTDNG